MNQSAAKTAKQLKSFRFGDQTISELETLCRRFNRSASEIIKLLIHAAATEAEYSELETWMELPE